MFERGKEVSEESVKEFGENLARVVKERLAEPMGQPRSGSLRMSNIGRPDRQLWYDVRRNRRGDLKAPARIKFLFGDILEQLLLFASREAGHSVTDLQSGVELGGVRGAIDAEIDGVVVDAKSTSSRAFEKFERGTLPNDDPFGYIDQLEGYRVGRGRTRSGFLAIDKQLGKIAFYEPPKRDPGEILERIEHVKQVVALDDPPERCYSDTEDGKSGNRKLAIGCSYCAHKFDCWSDANDGMGLRTYIYSSGPRYLTKVEREPDVPEILKGEDD